MVVQWVMDSPFRGWRLGSVASLLHTSESSEATMSHSSLCSIVGKAPIGQIIAWLVVNAVAQLHLVGGFGAFPP